jgi:hypothetical protein
LGRGADASACAARADEVYAAFVVEYLSPDRLPVDPQGVYVLALALGFVPEDRRTAVVAHLVRLVDAADDHLDTVSCRCPICSTCSGRTASGSWPGGCCGRTPRRQLPDGWAAASATSGPMALTSGTTAVPVIRVPRSTP